MRYSIICIISFIGLALWARYDYMGKMGHWQKEPASMDRQAFVIQLNDQTFTQVEKGIGFAPHAIRPDITTGALTALDSLANFLQEHNEKILRIDGSYQEFESRNRLGALASLGEGRAHWFAQALRQRGISQSRMILADTLISNNIPNFIRIQITPQPH